MTAYYNEFDPFAAAWLRNLIAEGHIAPGDVDERDLWDVHPDDLRPYTQVHLCAGIGVWSYALRRAGWSDDRPVWTASFPCQPFSAAGKGLGFDDPRHLWPAGFHLIRQCDPAIVLGEQVASKDGLAWLDLVRADVEATGRSFAAADLCAAGIGAPHIRQRTFWVADTQSGGDDGTLRRDQREGISETMGRGGFVRLADSANVGRREGGADSGGVGRGDSAQGWTARPVSGSAAIGLDDDDDARSQGHAGDDGTASGRQEPGRPVAAAGVSCGLDNAAGARYVGSVGKTEGLARNDARLRVSSAGREEGGTAPTNGFWRDADWLYCRDGKWRPVEPSTFPLAHGATNRVGRLRGYGNAIVAPVAETFIRAVIDARAYLAAPDL